MHPKKRVDLGKALVATLAMVRWLFATVGRAQPRLPKREWAARGWGIAANWEITERKLREVLFGEMLFK